MAYFLFIDESGQDHHDSPYEVLAGVCIKDDDLWKLIKDIHKLELHCFGRKYRDDQNEIKARKFLKRKTFKLAAQMPTIPEAERKEHAFNTLDPANPVTKIGLTALAQAKLAYVKGLLELCNEFRCKVFASIICDSSKIPSENTMLRRDYIYLFERFFYFLEDKGDQHQGIVVFDELDKSASHLVLTQMDRYFKSTQKGRFRSSLIIPEPFFVHSDLTTGIQIVDFAAYILSWSYRYGKLTKESRGELGSFVELLKQTRYRTTRDVGEGEEYVIWSIAIV